MLSRLIKRLFGVFATPREHYEPAGDPFLELDLSDVRRKLSPQELGAENGTQDIPASHTSSPDATERQFVAFFANELERAVKEAELRLGAYAERLKGLRTATAVPDLTAVADSTRQDLHTIADRGSNELFAQRRRFTGLERDLAEFRVTHGLEREPIEAKPALLVWGLLVLMLAIEVPLNGTLLAMGDNFGLVGGGIQALLLATINLLGAFAAGKFVISHLFHRSPYRRSAATLLLATCLPLIGAFNLAVGHYRDALVSGTAEKPAQKALAGLLAHPFRLDDLQSYLLLALGLVFASIAATDGYKSDDPYPGFGLLARRAAEAQDEFVAERRDCVDELQERRDQGFEEVKRVAQSIELAQQQNGVLRARQQQITQRFTAHRDYLIRCLMTIVMEYCFANRRSRSSPAPQHFQNDLQLPAYALAEFQGTEIDADHLRKAVEDANNRIAAAFDSALMFLPTVEQLSQIQSHSHEPSTHTV